MSSAPLAQYFQRRTNMSRANCSFLLEHFRLDAETGLLESVSVYEDGLAYHSAPAPLGVPVLAVPSTASAYDKALAKAEASEQKRKALAKIEKELRKKVDAMRRGLAELAREERTPTMRDVLHQVAVQVYPEPVDAPLPPVVERSESSPSMVATEPLPAVPSLLDDITVLDLEFQQEHMLEIAAIRYRNGEPVGELVSFVQFRQPVWRPITELTGIGALHVYDAPTEKTVLQQFKQLAGDSLLVCHNIGADRRVLEAARTRQGATELLPNAWLDTLALARKRLPKGQKCGLGELCHHFNIKVRGAHRAKADVLMCYQLLRCLHQQQPVTKGDLHGAPQPGKAKKVVPTGPGLFAAA